MDIAKPWLGKPYEATYKNWAGNTRKLTVEKGMSADSFKDVPGEPDMVICNLYLRCMSWEDVKVPRSGFEKPAPKPSIAKRARNALGRFMRAEA